MAGNGGWYLMVGMMFLARPTQPQARAGSLLLLFPRTIL